jgi:hypothetical protein
MKTAEAGVLEREVRAVEWIREVARPYLKGLAPSLERGSALRGYRFACPAGRGGKERLGVFAGFLLKSDGYEYLKPEPPECLVFAYVDPAGGPLHERLVREPESLFRKTHGFIAWLTHRPPRFQFSETGAAALVRHLPLENWPEGRHGHYARNFYIETLAWLVRSGLVQRLAAESSGNQKR